MASKKNRNKTRRRHAKLQLISAQPAQSTSQSPTAGLSINDKPASGWRALFQSLCALPGQSKIPPAFAAGALCGLIAISYFPATWGGLIWDDLAWYGAKPVLSWSGIWEIWFNPESLTNEGHYWPLLYSTFWLEHKLWGLSPVGYHITNLLLHASVTLLLWRVLLRMEIAGAWFIAALFAVHPVHVEPVVWIIGRKDILAALFSLVGVIYYLRFLQYQRHWHYWRALLAFVGGLLCKSTIITLPVVLLIWHWWKQGRVLATDVLRILPFMLVGLGITLADWGYYKAREVVELTDYSLFEKAMNAAHALWFYVGKLVLPTQLAVVYPQWGATLGEPLAWGYFIAAAALLGLLWFYRARIGRGALAGVLFFAVTLSPTLGFVEYGYMQFSLVADRYQYFAAVGIIAVVIASMTAVSAQITRKLPSASSLIGRGAQIMAIGLLSVFATLSWNQSNIYRSNTTFYSHIVATNTHARTAWYNLAREHSLAGNHADALAAYRVAGEQRPDHAWAQVGAGKAAKALGKLAESEAYFLRALAIDAKFQGALTGLGGLRLQQNRAQDALEIFQKLVKIAPKQAQYYSGVGVALAQLNRPAQALRSFDRALEIDPNLQEAQTNRAIVLQTMKNTRK